jgi:hypothetical protein
MVGCVPPDGRFVDVLKSLDFSQECFVLVLPFGYFSLVLLLADDQFLDSRFASFSLLCELDYFQLCDFQLVAFVSFSKLIIGYTLLAVSVKRDISDWVIRNLLLSLVISD